ncbi:MAG: hypothetical protein HOA61_04860 [Bacteroidetes bacterium]|nr:hypothetical protein [Bacteroidota bacterium]MBT6835353.1 hypothetical protein [Bacteroidota bacterium]
MRRLSLITLISVLVMVVLILGFKTEEPTHGENFKISCTVCHSPGGWKLDKEIYSFDHNTTALPLEGQHVETDCKLCHPTLIFGDAGEDCMDCHTDMHNASLGTDCERCHSPFSWIVSNISEIHYQSRFPLMGAHALADCYDCHKSASLLDFEPLGIECMDCHQQDYYSTSEPNHTTAGFSTECSECHRIGAFEWGSSGFNHVFFPLTQGHNLQDCNLCHVAGNYSNISTDCFSCHESDFNATNNPNHSGSGFSTDCSQCHTTNPGWKPATFDHDNKYFPIFSGKHNGEWNSCVDCHTNTSNYQVYTCIDCHDHNKSEMDKEHDEEPDYLYNSIACFDCHPRGTAD